MWTSLNLPLWLPQKYPLALILNRSVFIHLLELHPCIVNNGCFHFSPASSANTSAFFYISLRRSVTEYTPQSREKSAEMDLGWPNVVWGLLVGQRSQMLLPVHFNKRKKAIFPDVGEKQYLQLQVQLRCCFCEGWKVKSDTVSNSKTETD